MDDTMLDGNAVAGLLREVFLPEATTTVVTCGGCGAAAEMGTAHLYRGAGFVLRCPQCETSLMTLVRGDARMWLGFPGTCTLEVTVPDV